MSTDAREVFTVELAQYMEERAPSMKRVVPQVQTSGLLLYEGTNLRASMVGTTPAYKDVTNYEVRAGRSARTRCGSSTPVMVLGSRAAEELFGEADPLRQLTFVVGDRRYSFTVVG